MVWLRRGLIAILVVLLLPAVYFLYLIGHGNFHPITEGKAYRSAQLSREKLEFYVKNYHIRSILNLRGNGGNARWYLDELQVSRKYDIRHYDLWLSASREPSPEEVQILMAIFRDAPRPILIHCKGGADRAGLVAAMWKVIVDKEPKLQAEKQLSVMFGHLPVGETAAMDRFFDKWSRNPCWNDNQTAEQALLWSPQKLLIELEPPPTHIDEIFWNEDKGL